VTEIFAAARSQARGDKNLKGKVKWTELGGNASSLRVTREKRQKERKKKLTAPESSY